MQYFVKSFKGKILLIALLLLIVGGCVVQNKIQYPAGINSQFTVEEDKVLLIIGQDLDSIDEYVNSGIFPTPGGVTSYLAFYQLLSPSYPAYGALGVDINGHPLNTDVDWGAGPLNAYRSAVDYPGSALVIGLNIAEGSAGQIWASGGLADIAVGAYDKNILHLAQFFKSINRPVYLRIGYEFDGYWNSGYEKKNSYIFAYRHIVDVLRTQAVDNVQYVWQASASPLDDIVEGFHEDIKSWYPGDNYVDLMGLSWFLSPYQVKKQVESQSDLADEVLSFARQQNKQVMIAEAAPQGYDLHAMTRSNISSIWDGEAGMLPVKKTPQQIWQEWYVPFFKYIHDNSDVIRAVAYINANWNAQKKWSGAYTEGYWGDSRIQSSPQLMEYWLKEINNPEFWQHGHAVSR